MTLTYEGFVNLAKQLSDLMICTVSQPKDRRILTSVIASVASNHGKLAMDDKFMSCLIRNFDASLASSLSEIEMLENFDAVMKVLYRHDAALNPREIKSHRNSYLVHHEIWHALFALSLKYAPPTCL